MFSKEIKKRKEGKEICILKRREKPLYKIGFVIFSLKIIDEERILFASIREWSPEPLGEGWKWSMANVPGSSKTIEH